MRDAFGGAYSLSFVLVAIVVITSLIAYFVNYNKAFIVKNKLVTTFKAFENDPTKVNCDVNSDGNCIVKAMDAYTKKVGYAVSKEYMQPLLRYKAYYMNRNYKCTDGGWCYMILCETEDDNGNVKTVYNNDCQLAKGVNGLVRRYAKVVTFVSIDVPVFNKIFSNMNLFRVTGSSSPTVTLAGTK